MKYREYTEARQNEFNQLPIFYAFGNKQFEEQLAKRGIKLEDAREHVYRLSDTGGFYLKKDVEQIRAYFKTDHDAELRNIMSNDLEFAREAFEYEMYNHEYPINWQGDWDVASCFGSVEFDEDKSGEDYLRELGFAENVVQVWKETRRKVIQNGGW